MSALDDAKAKAKRVLVDVAINTAVANLLKLATFALFVDAASKEADHARTASQARGRRRRR